MASSPPPSHEHNTPAPSLSQSQSHSQLSSSQANALSPSQSNSPTQPHPLSLVLQSKNALQHGEQLCSRANHLSHASAQVAVDILALDAKLRWITESVVEQLELAVNVATSLEDKRTTLDAHIHEWDTLRIEQTDKLDRVLDSLGAQHVPPGFHQTSPASSIFGSQHDEARGASGSPHTPGTSPSRASLSPRASILVSPAATLRNEPRRGEASRSGWKTLRDFVSDKDIDAALESMENDRTIFDDLRVPTLGYTADLTSTVSDLRTKLPHSVALPGITDVLSAQDTAMHEMAKDLEGLTAHYDQIAGVLKAHEDGAEELGEDELEEINQDMGQLPAIIEDLERGCRAVEEAYDELQVTKQNLEEHLARQPVILDSLDELGDIMTEMLERQAETDTHCVEQLSILQDHLANLGQLHKQYEQYQTSFHKLLLEIARRRHYQEGMSKIVDEMVTQLRELTHEEDTVRSHFNAKHGPNMPEDLCLCIENTPTRWDILPSDSGMSEVIPEIDEDLLVRAKEKLLGAGVESVIEAGSD
ncbi:autophagy protein Apg17-domain-containing protein [Pterulicium gracile]|uniref:Autophagy-related protein 17 n=1 Tax=Pterulicium gracile TaxID=1884261 RepID=A0A5C3QG48_9AGAR|nr:autophagy protein Apg17-domain-containing protein [Pterula gracilis]